MSKTRVSFEEVLLLCQRIDEINAISFGDIEWTRGGEVLSVPPERAEQWRFVGLGNTSFVEFYEP